MEVVLGYVFPAIGDETFAFRYDAVEQTEVLDGGAEGIAPTRRGEQGYHNWFFQERLAARGGLAALRYDPAAAAWWWPNPIRAGLPPTARMERP